MTLRKSPHQTSIDSTGTPLNLISPPLNVIRRRARDESLGSKLPHSTQHVAKD
jgi:hypothetical protein